MSSRQGLTRDQIAEFEEVKAEFETFVQVTRDLGIVLVLSAGNGARWGSLMGDHLPQLLGTKENHIITVGAVTADGTFWPGTELEGKRSQDTTAIPNDANVGSMTLYAQGVGVLSCNGDSADSTGVTPRDGTSFASPAVVSTHSISMFDVHS